MPEKENLLVSIADIIKDYRIDELDQPTPDHVDKWVNQFSEKVRLPILRELMYVFAKNYYNKKRISDWIDQFTKYKGIAGDNPTDFWTGVNFLNIQKKGDSQKRMLSIIESSLNESLGLDINNCGTPEGPYLYVDDFLFSGFHVGDDLEAWINECSLRKAKIFILLLETYSLGLYKVKVRLDNAIKVTKKNVEYQFFYGKKSENRNSCKKDSDVLWPSELPGEQSVMDYLAQDQKFPFSPRPVGGVLSSFSSEAGRQLLEKEFLLAGLKIRSFSENPKEVLRPLGFSSFGLGFGSMIVSYRNCPNNCPLALWWGNPKAGKSSPLSKWYPLFQRKINDEEN